MKDPGLKRRVATRRTFLGALTGGALLAPVALRASSQDPPRNRLRVRAITAGVNVDGTDDLAVLDRAIAVLGRARAAFEASGYEVQTVRLATQPFADVRGTKGREHLARIRAMDGVAVAKRVSLAIGPVAGADDPAADFPAWAAELIRSTRNTSFTIAVSSPDGGVDQRAVTASARVMRALSTAADGGVGNFRFAAAASVPPGSPFFPVAYHDGNDTLGIGMESAHLVEEAARGASSDPASRVRATLNAELAPVERIAAAFAMKEGWTYGGIDPSPAPGMDRSIGAAIEAMTGVPFGESSTLNACAAVTEALKSLNVRTCGYRGLMLPVLEDPVLARRAGEGRYGIQELLLYSSVCGTGLDVVPVPGDTPVEVLARIVLDVAALSVKLRKPLSARLFPIPGKAAGERARFDDPLLTDAIVFRAS